MRISLLSVILSVMCFSACGEDANSLTSNVATVKAWKREFLTFDDATGTFSRTNFPSFTQAEAIEQVATNIPPLLSEATTSMSNNLAQLRATIENQRSRPVTTVFMAAGPSAALDRRNLTFVSLSNEVVRTSDGFDVSQWVFSSAILRSAPIMDCDITTSSGTTFGGEFTWEHYGTNAVTIVDRGEDYECYKMTCHVKTAATNLNVYVAPWIQIARKGKMFDFGNRRMRINQVYAATTNDLSWIGRFTTTNGTEITYRPFADKGRFLWTENED